MRLLRGPAGPDPVFEMAVTQALLRKASDDPAAATLRVYRPRTATIAFGRRDLLLPGFPQAVKVARNAGFRPVVRPTGGRVVAYTPMSLVIEHVQPDADPKHGLGRRFAEYGTFLADVLGRLGIDARVGEVPGEYCPGSHSVNARGEVKLIGTAQRVVRDAWLFSSVLVFDGIAQLRPVLTEVHHHLDLPFDPASVGSVHAEAEWVGLGETFLSLGEVEEMLISAYAEQVDLEEIRFLPDLLDLADELSADHAVE